MADEQRQQGTDRREFLSRIAMTAGLASSYGALALISGRFLYPARAADRCWQFVIEEHRLAVGEAIVYRAPGGSAVTVARHGSNGDANDFIALSSTCPHLGCRVRWESSNRRFFCPCHNGSFDHGGLGNGGPPGRAGQSLPRYRLKLEEGLLHIEVPSPRLAGTAGQPTGSDSVRRPV